MKVRLSSTGNTLTIFTINHHRTKTMDDWLMQKKMQEAKKIAQLRELEEKEEI